MAGRFVMPYSLYLPPHGRECNFSTLPGGNVIKTTYLRFGTRVARSLPVRKYTVFFSLMLLAGCGRSVPQPQSQQEQQQTPPPGVTPPPAQEQELAQNAEGEGAGPAPAPSPLGSAELTGRPVEAAYKQQAVRIPSGISVHVRLGNTIDTSRSRAGDRFTATLSAPVSRNGRVVLPKGTVFHGHVTEAKSSGRLRGRAVLGLTLDSFQLRGRTYDVQTSSIVRASADHKRRNLGFIGGGSGLGAVIGAIAGGGKGALIGAGAGAAAGTAGAAATGKRNLRLPVETPLTFTLRNPVEV